MQVYFDIHHVNGGWCFEKPDASLLRGKIINYNQLR